MQITNPDHDLVIDYQESEKQDDDVVVRFSRFSDGRTNKQTFTRAGAVEDMADFLVNYNYHKVGLTPHQQVLNIQNPISLPMGLGKTLVS
ncbi:MAG: hypothetical protein KAS93_06735 [Gammaproteobacteria bacterium]|nr:hypothetical protein [Gammaproteobacteria bacterium]